MSESPFFYKDPVLQGLIRRLILKVEAQDKKIKVMRRAYDVLDEWHNGESKMTRDRGRYYRWKYRSDEGHNGVDKEVVVDGIRKKE